VDVAGTRAYVEATDVWNWRPEDWNVDGVPDDGRGVISAAQRCVLGGGDSS
jgi:hypothetical protein